VSGIVLTLLLRSPAPPPPQPCAIPAAQQDPSEAIAARVVEALRDTFPTWSVGQDVASIKIAVVGIEGTVWRTLALGRRRSGLTRLGIRPDALEAQEVQPTRFLNRDDRPSVLPDGARLQRTP
jgi:hypothetical protein